MNSSARARMGAQAAEIDIIDCQNSQYSYSATGFVIDHFSWCQAGYYSVTIKRCGTFGCSDIGKAYFRLTTIGYGTDGSRKIEFVTLMDELKMTGDVAQVSAQTLQLSMGCTAYLEATCTKDPNNGRTDTIAGWQNVPSAFFRFTSPLEGTSGLEQISWYDFQQTLTLVNSGDSVDMGGNAFRCDSATYVNNPGCVFDLVNELWYDLSISNPEVDETAQHIYDAQYRPEFTFPWFEGKTVPGSIDSAEPLSRVFHDLSLRRANHRTAVSTCKKVYGDDYATKGLDCDEYPFQSTYQGAAAGDNRYSARALTSTDNQKAGSMLSSWYGSQRILDGDHFFVIINS